MSSRWIVRIAAAAALAGALGCGESEEAKQAANQAARQTEWSWLETAKKDLDAKRGEVAALEARAAAGEDVAAAIATAQGAVEAAEDEHGQRLAKFINDDPPVVGEPMKPLQVAAIRMKSAEDIHIAGEFVAQGGDYRKAIEILQSAKVADPDNPELEAAIARTEAERYMSAERFAGVKKGMTEAEVRALLGVPYHRNVKEYPDKQVTAWFYPTNPSNDAAGVYFNAKKVVYDFKFEAIKADKS
jgi:hypothetical protein